VNATNLTITIVKHRGKTSFRWYEGGKPRYRVVKDEQSAQAEEIQLRIDLQNGVTEGMKREAEKQRQADAAERQRQDAAKHKTLADHIENFYLDIATDSPKHALLLRRRIERLFEAADIQTVEDISAAKLRTTIGRMRCHTQSPKKKPTDYPLLSPQSKRYYAKAARQLTKWLDEEGYMTDPLKKWKPKKYDKVVERHARDRLQPEELEKLVKGVYISGRWVQNFDSPTRSWLYLIASMTGLRRGEIATLTPKSFDLAAKKVVVGAEDTKNGKEANLPLPKAMIADLKKWLVGKRGPLFPGLAKKDTAKMIRRDLEALGIPYKTGIGERCFHALRNTFISRLFDAGLPLAQIQRSARHGDIRQTLKYGKAKADEASFVDQLDYPGLT
jgi:integrase